MIVVPCTEMQSDPAWLFENKPTRVCAHGSFCLQEFSEDMGSAASRLGTSLFSSLAFSKFKSSKSFKDAAAAASASAAGDESGGDAAADVSAAAAAEAAAAAAAEEEAARHMPAASSAPVLAGSSSGAEGLFAEGSAAEGDQQPYTSLTFGALGSASVAAAGSASLAVPGSPPGASPGLRSPLGGSARSSATGSASAAGGTGAASGGTAAGGGAGIARVAGGAVQPGSKTAQGRLDFVMQVGHPKHLCLQAACLHALLHKHALPAEACCSLPLP